MLRETYAGRRVLVTGHTGFKGAWLSEWLLGLGARVTGLSLPPPTDPSLFQALALEPRLAHCLTDIRAADAVADVVAAARPEIVFHLAAQPLVRLSYREPKLTWDTNVGGAVNLLEALRATPGVRACVVITSDKCYENREWVWGYRETDALGGHDPYSASKGAAEIVAHSYRRAFFDARPEPLHLATARAGNVIGGGDWAADRIVTDFVTSISRGRPVVLRNPRATRPFQHVLEPLSGYLQLGAHLLGADGHRFADAWNFGPGDRGVATVEALASLLVAAWGRGEIERLPPGDGPHEAGLLTLDCNKARSLLGWRAVWDLETTVRRTAAWYRAFLAGDDVLALTRRQIADYQEDARRAGLRWASGGG